MSNLFRFLFGTCVFSFPAEDKKKILNFLLEKGIGALSCTTCEGEGRLTVLRRDAKKMPNELCVRVADYGAISFFASLLRRPGLVAGVLVTILLLVLSSLTLWRVEVVGNEEVGAIEIEHALASSGLSVGCFTPSLDIAEIKTRFLQKKPEISWVGIYVRGTTAYIEVREAKKDKVDEGADRLCNLVAADDGVIERISVDAGRAVVAQGATVRKGELLISGIYRTATGLRTIRAEGEVLARCEATLSLHQPFANEEKCYGKSSVGEIFLEFFGKKIKLFKKSGKTAAEYDIIKRKEQIVLFGEIALPIFIERYEILPYTVQRASLSEDEAVRMAFSRLRTEMAARFREAEIVAERVYAEWTDTGYSLTCRVEYITDIAMPLTYDAETNGG